MTTEVNMPTTSPASAADVASAAAAMSNKDKATLEAIAAVLNALYGTNKKPSELANEKLREEQLFAALTYRELKKKNPRLAKEFIAQLPRSRRRQKADNEKNPLFKATDAFLRQIRDQNKISPKEFEKIEKIALGKAELGDKVSRFDPEKKLISSNVEDTQAKSNIEAILERINSNQIASAKELKQLKRSVKGKRPKNPPKKTPPKPQPKPSDPCVTPPPNTGPSETDKTGEAPSEAKLESGPNDFVFKPISEKDGNLLIQLPEGYSKEVTDLKIYSESGELLADLRLRGYGDDGRAYWSLERPGTDLGENLRLRLEHQDGTQTEIEIPSSKNNYVQEFSI